MKKAFTQLLVLLFTFLGCWLALSQINYLSIFKINETKTLNEQKIGDLIWEQYKKNTQLIENPKIITAVNTIKQKLFTNNHINASKIQIHVVSNDEINAFALPNGHLVLHSGLISWCNNPEELAAVMAHEIAHIEKKHIMDKMVKEMGSSVLSALINSKQGGEMLKQVMQRASSTAFDRELESEADATAVTYLFNANIDPEYLATFLMRLSATTDMSDLLVLLNTHPNSKERAGSILNQINKLHLKNKTSALDSLQWNTLTNSLKDNLSNKLATKR
ncbi:M48 family metallopeptidase [Solitalea sp. MAHUQ-68]|uniref:M48 family metallopeptidase n=1 Tax=Solitalea agri TaxID=2953739 RepID=A0A9X2JBD8_9SPHI|nr:M48 family metallopeptidase [Solitalea agri]MCO4291923.1 M48 family metallopeptidase [Solitalea agri]